jgi:hypothetical protein
LSVGFTLIHVCQFTFYINFTSIALTCFIDGSLYDLEFGHVLGDASEPGIASSALVHRTLDGTLVKLIGGATDLLLLFTVDGPWTTPHYLTLRLIFHVNSINTMPQHLRK